MTDRELLELAAKAAGIHLHETEDGFEADYDDSRIWNPLTEDGDALRLAVKLCLSLITGPCVVSCNSIPGALRGEFIKEDCIEQDHYVATRRAIVRAAAEIGKEMK
jgi:hypothetical protein